MKTFLFLTIVTLSEASIGVFVKLVDGQIPIAALNFYRVLFAALFLGCTLPFVRPDFWNPPRDNIRDTVVVGALIAAQISMFNLAMTLAPIANVVVFWSVAPFFVFIFSTLFLGERPRRLHLVIFALAGVGLVIAKPLEEGYAAGNLIALLDGAVYAAMVTYLRNEGRQQQAEDIFWFMLAATAFLSPALFLVGPGNLLATSSHALFGLPVPVFLWAVCLGVLSTGVAFLFISAVLQHINANLYALIDIIVSPLVAALLGYWIFSEVPSMNMIYGAALLLASGLWLTLSRDTGNG